MIVCAVGDVHGALDRFCDELLAFERSLGVAFDLVLQVGDLGIWPDPKRIDRAARNCGGAGDFPAWWQTRRGMPRPTMFVAGNHEDHDFLRRLPLTVRGTAQVLPNLHWLPNRGCTWFKVVPGHENPLIVGGTGGCFAPSSYERPREQRALRHIGRDDVVPVPFDWEYLAGGCNVLLFHDSPVAFTGARHHFDRVERREARAVPGLCDAVLQVQPALCFFGHHHVQFDGHVGRTRCIGLNLLGQPGCMRAFEITGMPMNTTTKMLGSWPGESWKAIT